MEEERKAPATALSNVQVHHRLAWKTLVAGSERPGAFDRAMRSSGGWHSAEGTAYPLDIILGLETEAAISRVDVTVDDFLLPRRIDFKVGRLSARSSRSQPRLSYSAAKAAEYHDSGRAEFDSRSKNTADGAREVVSYWFGRGNPHAVGQYLWLVVDEPHPSVENSAQRVHLSRLDVYGAKLGGHRGRRKHSSRRRRRRRSSDNSSRNSSPGMAYRPRDRSKTTKGAVTNRLGFRRWRLSSASSSHSGNSNDSYDYLEAEAIPCYPLTGTSDPLTALRNVRELIQERRARAVREGSDVEALLCRRNIELIRAYESEMLEAREKLEAAKRDNDGGHVAHYEAAIEDIRDTCYRNIHLDLLLERYAPLTDDK